MLYFKNLSQTQQQNMNTQKRINIDDEPESSKKPKTIDIREARRKERIKIINNAFLKIKESKADEIDLLKTTACNDYAAVARRSHMTKDPNPLSTTISTMNLRFPICILNDKTKWMSQGEKPIC